MLMYRPFEEKLPRFMEELRGLFEASDQLQGLITKDLEELL